MTTEARIRWSVALTIAGSVGLVFRDCGRAHAYEVLVQVESLASDRGWALRGPGIETAAALYAAPLPSDFLAQLRTNAAGYPCGVDIIFVAGNSIAALPRSTRVEA